MEHKLHNVILARLDAIANAEKITRVELAAFSREALEYVPDTHDIDIVNRLINVLTPMNRKTAIAFFTEMLPWTIEYEKDGETFARFGAMEQKLKKRKRKLDAIVEFLADESNNIWTWADANITVEVKKKDFAGLITKQVEKALKGDEKSDTDPLTHADVIKAVILGGISIDDLMAAVTASEEEEKEQVAEVMAA